ncbi:MAG: copper chaperone PCu(A)C [Alphaproteobacteria bacterium]|nr:copper chaperone PCu(A)C [Alphaproteobacteria bacterium]
MSFRQTAEPLPAMLLRAVVPARWMSHDKSTRRETQREPDASVLARERSIFFRFVNSNTLHFAGIAALILLILATPAKAAPTLSNGWIRWLPAGLPAAGYFDLHNGGEKTVSLTGASSPACGMVMLHKSETAGGAMRMEDVSSVEVAPGATLKFAPGGYHLMCMNPNPALKPGGRTAVTLVFSDGTKLTGEFAVRNAAGE